MNVIPQQPEPAGEPETRLIDEIGSIFRHNETGEYYMMIRVGASLREMIRLSSGTSYNFGEGKLLDEYVEEDHKLLEQHFTLTDYTEMELS